MDPDPELESLVEEVATSAKGDLSSTANQGWRDRGANVELTLKEIKAVQLRSSGATYQDIADALGYESRSSAFRAVRRALQRWGSEAVDELRVLELARLDQITLKLWPKVLGRPARDHGDGTQDAPVPPDMKAMELYLKVSQRRAKLLGLDAPTMVDFTMDPSEMPGEQVVSNYETYLELVEQIANDQVAYDDDQDPPTGDEAESSGGGQGGEAAEHPVLPSRSDDEP